MIGPMVRPDGAAVRPWYKRRWTLLLLVPVCGVLYLAIQTPSNGGPWREDHVRSAYAELSGRSLTVHNIRNFRYKDGQKITSREYFSKTWQLDDIEYTWFGLSHFGPFGLAHSFISIEFRDGEHLALSIEARLRPGQIYNPIAGLFRRYPKIYIAATEQDIIGVRSHQRGETVLLYPVDDTPEASAEYFLALLNDANALQDEPEFYNTVLDNCLTNLLKYAADFAEISATDFRVLLPGHTDRLTYAFGITPADIPFESARQLARIDPTLFSIDDPDFSAKIRCGWYGVRPHISDAICGPKQAAALPDRATAP
jgi:hypothetical protein